VPPQYDENSVRPYPKSVVDSGPTIKDPKDFTSFALGMPGKGEMKQVIE
jgi:hypothetical protein